MNTHRNILSMMNGKGLMKLNGYRFQLFKNEIRESPDFDFHTVIVSIL